jgi:hypothetical protein
VAQMERFYKRRGMHVVLVLVSGPLVAASLVSVYREVVDVTPMSIGALGSPLPFSKGEEGGEGLLVERSLGRSPWNYG